MIQNQVCPDHHTEYGQVPSSIEHIHGLKQLFRAQYENPKGIKQELSNHLLEYYGCIACNITTFYTDRSRHASKGKPYESLFAPWWKCLDSGKIRWMEEQEWLAIRSIFSSGENLEINIDLISPAIISDGEASAVCLKYLVDYGRAKSIAHYLISLGLIDSKESRLTYRGLRFLNYLLESKDNEVLYGLELNKPMSYEDIALLNQIFERSDTPKYDYFNVLGHTALRLCSRENSESLPLPLHEHLLERNYFDSTCLDRSIVLIPLTGLSLGQESNYSLYYLGSHVGIDKLLGSRADRDQMVSSMSVALGQVALEGALPRLLNLEEQDVSELISEVWSHEVKHQADSISRGLSAISHRGDTSVESRDELELTLFKASALTSLAQSIPEGRSIEPLHDKDGLNDILEMILQLLFWHRSFVERDFTLDWHPKISASDARLKLSNLYERSLADCVEIPEIRSAILILSEAIRNIRINTPVEDKEEIICSYVISDEPGFVSVKIAQEQHEGQKFSSFKSKSLERMNRYFRQCDGDHPAAEYIEFSFDATKIDTECYRIESVLEIRMSVN